MIKSSLTLELVPSRRLCSVLLAAHGLASGACVALLFAGPSAAPFSGAMLLLITVIATALGFQLRRYGWRSRWFIARLSHSQVDQRWRLVTATGVQQLMSLEAYYLHPRLVILNLVNTDQRHFSLVISSDATNTDSFRQLRLLLTRLEIDDNATAESSAVA